MAGGVLWGVTGLFGHWWMDGCGRLESVAGGGGVCAVGASEVEIIVDVDSCIGRVPRRPEPRCEDALVE